MKKIRIFTLNVMLALLIGGTIPQAAAGAGSLDLYAECLHEAQGYYYKLLAAALEEKLAESKNLTDEERRKFTEDIASVKAAVNTGLILDPDARIPRRWMNRLTLDEFEKINRDNMRFTQKIDETCGAKYGGDTKDN